MAVNSTHQLVLHAVELFGPVNGYQIRRELMSWHVDEWAHVNPGSIYHSLGHLTKRGLILRHDLVDAGRAVAVYQITDTGHATLRRWQLHALESVDVEDRVGFQVAFAGLPALSRDEAIPAMERRQRALAELIARFHADARTAHTPPPHAVRSWDLWLRLAEAEASWLSDTVAALKDGSLPFQYEEGWGWQPDPDDPGHQMTRDRERYRSLLDRS